MKKPSTFSGLMPLHATHSSILTSRRFTLYAQF